MVIGIEHTAIASPDVQKLAQWYVETLGFVINYNSGKTVFIKAPNGSMIEIITSEGGLAPKTMKDAGLRHLALTVGDYDAAFAQLKAKGVSFLGEPIVNAEVKVAFFTDIEGNFLHIIQRLKPLG
jgi:catechol 2,3-dioxygenase-like lactoylglutathione lyase family enzyme